MKQSNTRDDFWTERLPLFTAQFPAYYTKPQKVYGRFHVSEESYLGSSSEIIPPQTAERHTNLRDEATLCV